MEKPPLTSSRTVERIFLITTPIYARKNNKVISQATGFFFRDKDQIYLVTNKHVIYGDDFAKPNVKAKCDEFVIVLHTNSADLTMNEQITIPLYKGKQKQWKLHSDPSIDVVCLPITLDEKKFLISVLEPNALEDTDLVVGFEQLYVFGYPYGWYDKLHNLPVVRIGHLSSPYKVPFHGLPINLADVETHKGMSGSPVLIHISNVRKQTENGMNIELGTWRYILLGVYSGQPIIEGPDDKGKNVSIPHSLSVVWFGELIQDIISR